MTAPTPKKLKQLNKYLNELLVQKLTIISDTLTKQICIDYKLPLDEIKHKYAGLIQKTLEEQFSECDTSSRECLARTANGERCSRKRKTELFCGCHAENQPFGRIDMTDDLSPTATMTEPKKRGRPLAELNVSLEKINGITYYVDKEKIYQIRSQIGSQIGSQSRLSSNENIINMDDLKLVGIKINENTIDWM